MPFHKTILTGFFIKLKGLPDGKPFSVAAILE